MRIKSPGKTVFLLLFFYTSRIYLSAYDVPLPEDEASPVLYSGEIGDADVDLFMTGSWKIDLSYGTTLKLPHLYPAAAYNIMPGLFFQQLPDLTLSLWLLNSYFIEASFYPGYENNSYAIGYMGQPEDFIKMARIGNDGRSIPQHSVLRVPDGGAGGIDAYINFGNEKWDNHFLLRYDSFEREAIEYRGNSLLSASMIPLESYIRGKYFLLPDMNVAEVRIFIQSHLGDYSADDGNRYELLEPSTYILHQDSGYLEFKSPLTTSAVISYTSAYGDVGEPGGGVEGLTGTDGGHLDSSAPPEDFDWGSVYLGIPMSDYRITISSGSSYTGLLLWNNGSFSPFEITAVYPGSAGSASENVRGYLVYPDSTENEEPVTLEPGENALFVVPSDSFPRASRRFPFTDYISAWYSGTTGQKSGYLLHIEQLNPLTAVPFPADAIEGSVTILVNGLQTSAYTVTNGVISFSFPLRDSDSVKIIYSRKSPDANTLLQTSSHRYRYSDNLSIHAASAFLWTISPHMYSESYGQYPGLLLGNAGFAYSRKGLDVSADYTVSLGTEDSTGNLFLTDFLENINQVETPGSILPPAPSSDPLSPFSYADFVIPLYRDYRIQSEGISYIQDINTAISSTHISQMMPGSQVGPYLAKGNSMGYSGTLAVAEAVLPQDSWTGFTLKVTDTETIPDSISFLATYMGTGEVSLYARFGAIAEDCDSDMVLDEESTSSGTGFIYNPGPDSFRFGGGIVSPGNGYRETEDLNGDGILSPENTDLVVETEIATLTQTGTLVRYVITFTDAQKAALKDIRGLQLIARAESAGGASGRFAAGDFRFSSQAVRIEAENGSTYYYEDNRDIRYTWHDEVSPHSITIPLEHFPRSAYRKLTLPYRNPDNSRIPAETVLTVKTGPSSGFTATLPLIVDSSWHEIDLDLESMTVETGGFSSVMTAFGTPGPHSGDTITALNLEFSDSDSGTLYLGQPKASQPVSSVEHGIRLNAVASIPGLPSWIGLTVHSTLSAASGNAGNVFVPELSDRHIYIHEEEILELPKTELRLIQKLNHNGDEFRHGFGHNVAFAPFPWIRIEERYLRSAIHNDIPAETGNSILYRRQGLMFHLDMQAIHYPEYYHMKGQSELAIPLPGNLSLSLSEKLGHKTLSPEPGFDYFKGWYETKHTLFNFDTHESHYRTSGIGSSLSWKADNAIKIQGTLSMDSVRSFVSSTPLCEETIGWGLSSGFPASKGTINLGLDHKGTFTSSWDSNGDYLEDTVDIFAIFHNNRSALLVPPLYHLFPLDYDRLLGTERTDTVITSNGNLGYSRQVSYNRSDLILPSRISYRLTREITVSNNSVDDNYTHNAAFRWETRNLFGRLGRYPQVKWYDTEDYFSVLSMSISPCENRYSYDLSHDLTLYTRGKPTWIAVHTLLFTQEKIRDDIGIKYIHDRPVREIRMLNGRLTCDTLRNTEELGLTLGSRKNERLLNLLFRHSTDMVFGQNGTVGVFFKLDYLDRASDGSAEGGLGIEIGIRGEITF